MPDSINQRPLLVTVFSWLMIAAGTVGVIYHASEFKELHPFPYEVVGVEFIRVLAIVAGVYMLKGYNWARWLTISWLAFHVVVSGMNSLREFLPHVILFALLVIGLFRTDANGYFRRAQTA
jgi:hypothetical protein